MFAREAWYVPLSMVRQYGRVAALRRHQLRGLNRMLRHARDTVPYYRDRIAYDRPRLRSLADVARLPVLTKDELRSLPRSDFVADGTDQDSCTHHSTSGTTGRRILVLHDANSHDYHMAACVRRFLATGRYLPTDRLSHLKGFPMPKRSFERFGLFRRHLVSTNQPMRQIKAELLGSRPQVIIGYPVHLRELARALDAAELARLRRHLKFVMTESELLVPGHRELLTSTFGVPVFDEYSSYETLNIYFECTHGGRHIAEDRVLVEVLDDDGRPVPDGVEGQIVCTPFMSRAMPLIRYALRDLGQIDPTPCPCRRRFRTMRLSHGRLNDCVPLPNGTRLYADVFLSMAEKHPGIAECFVRQDSTGAVRVGVVPDGTVPILEVCTSVRDWLFAKAGAPFPLEVFRADRVPITEGDKGRFVESTYQT